MATVATPITTAELLAMPDNRMECWLVEGELRERPMTTWNLFHSFSMTRVARYLDPGWIANRNREGRF